VAEQSDADYFIPRTVGVELARITTQCDGVGAESHLIQYMSECPPEDWRSRPWGTQIVATVENARIDPSFAAVSTRAMQIRLWKEVHTPRSGALIHVRGNEAIYRGPLLWLPEWIEMSGPKGVIIPKDSPLIIPNSLAASDTRWRAEVHLGAIGVRFKPFLLALRRDFGDYLVDRAVKQLQEQGLLLPAFTGPTASGKPTGPLKLRVPVALLESRPLPDDGYTDWAKRALPNDSPHSVSTFLWENKGLWKKAGGKPVSRGRKSHV
jgi:hypothetical protein